MERWTDGWIHGLSLWHLDKDSTRSGHLSFFVFNQNPGPWPVHSSVLDSPEDQYVNENVKLSLKVKTHTESSSPSPLPSLHPVTHRKRRLPKVHIEMRDRANKLQEFLSLDLSSTQASRSGKLFRCFCMNKTSKTTLQLTGNIHVKPIAGNPCQLPPTSLSVPVLSTEARIFQVRAQLPC